MDCFFRSKPFDDDVKPIGGYRQRMMQEWKEHGVFESTDQARAIRKNGWLSDLELGNIRRMIDTESEIVNESIEDVEENQTERYIVRISQGNDQIGDDSDETINNVATNVETLDEQTRLIIAQLNKILAGGRNTDGISFKKVDMKTLNSTDQARAIRKNSWLSDLELGNIRRMIDAESEIVNESIEDVEEDQTERDIVRISQGNDQIGDDSDETINNVATNVETLDEQTRLIIAQLNKILAGGRNTDGISFKKVDMKTLNRTTAKVNRVIELIDTKNITQTNNLIKAAGVWVADQLGLKKYEGGKDP